MELILDPKPFLLYETVSMLYKYINQISIVKIMEIVRRAYPGQCDDNWVRRMVRLQEIMEHCCADLDPEDEELRRLFGRMETGCSNEETCLAYTMTMSFLQFRCHDLAEEAEVLKECWRNLQKTGYHFSSFGGFGLDILPLQPGEVQKNLFQMVYALKYPAEFRLEIYNFLQEYDSNLDRLVQILEPYACRLRACLEEEPWLMETTVAYWRQQFETVTPEEFFGRSELMNHVFPIAPERRVCFMLMNCADMTCRWTSPEAPKWSLFIFGCAVLANASRRCRKSDPDQVAAILRSIGEKSRFELLRRLAKERSYCQKLAEEMGSNTGNTSRNLTALWKEGFLIRKEEDARVYYETDVDSLIAFLRDVQAVLTE